MTTTFKSLKAHVCLYDRDSRHILSGLVPVKKSVCKSERWITINSDHEGGGTHIKIDDSGKIVGGPKELADRGIRSLGDFGKKEKQEHAHAATLSANQSSHAANSMADKKKPHELARDHETAATSHETAAIAHEAAGNHKDAEKHRSEAEDHRSIAAAAKENAPSEKRAVINVGPMATNVLDLVGTPLVDSQGRKVQVDRSGNDFVIRIDGKTDHKTTDNLSASYRLNQLEVSKDDSAGERPPANTDHSSHGVNDKNKNASTSVDKPPNTASIMSGGDDGKNKNQGDGKMNEPFTKESWNAATIEGRNRLIESQPDESSARMLGNKLQYPESQEFMNAVQNAFKKNAIRVDGKDLTGHQADAFRSIKLSAAIGGSEKQNEWADNIRIQKMHELAGRLAASASAEKSKEYANKLNSVLNSKLESKFWIDNRNLGPKELMQKLGW